MPKDAGFLLDVVPILHFIMNGQPARLYEETPILRGFIREANERVFFR